MNSDMLPSSCFIRSSWFLVKSCTVNTDKLKIFKHFVVPRENLRFTVAARIPAWLRWKTFPEKCWASKCSPYFYSRLYWWTLNVASDGDCCAWFCGQRQTNFFSDGVAKLSSMEKLAGVLNSLHHPWRFSAILVASSYWTRDYESKLKFTCLWFGSGFHKHVVNTSESVKGRRTASRKKVFRVNDIVQCSV